MNWDLNCDLGEGESPIRTRALMRWITSANVACGGHAGDERSMRRCAALARENGVRLGAHPGSRDRASMGRRPVQIGPKELERLLVEQVSTLGRIAAEEGASLHHVKLHGGLYHAVEGSAVLARVYLDCLQTRWPGIKSYAFAGGRVIRLAKKMRIEAWGEAFVDRGYLDDGRLVPRAQPGALLENRSAIQERVRDLCQRSRVQSLSGRVLCVHAQTLCVHGDTPSAAFVARWTRRILENEAQAPGARSSRA
ncbi:MAG: LamB/YcsF family protein [Verrucomicrobia bacterium]|nr:LamB/YcsF family protein [Verrucomicrobiota bacterium]MBI3868986.1 LamB/YcsF family protein [Verrucomicrobiota bacterium]